jgi:hypothetical protein
MYRLLIITLGVLQNRLREGVKDLLAVGISPVMGCVVTSVNIDSIPALISEDYPNKNMSSRGRIESIF